MLSLRFQSGSFRACLLALSGIFCVFAGKSPAQALPDARLPKFPMPGATASAQRTDAAVAADPQHGEETPPAEQEPVVTMAPHPETARYWFSCQANVIF